MTILILGYFYPKTWVVWITGKITQKFGLFLPTGFYSVQMSWIYVTQSATGSRPVLITQADNF